MRSLEPYWGTRARDFVDAIEAAKSSACIISQFKRMIGELGFHTYIMAGIPVAGQSLQQTTIANGWPAEWFELYNRENLSAVDPAPPALLQYPQSVRMERGSLRPGARTRRASRDAARAGIPVQRRFERCGWKAHPLGLPQMIDGMSVLAVLVDCDDTTWQSLCRQIGQAKPTLVWHGLADVSRLALPDLSSPFPASVRQA
jgi:hypothetical protein